MPRLPSELFRKGALRHHSAVLGDVLRLTPAWTRLTYPVLVVSFLVAALYCTCGTIHEYATGPAMVWMSGYTRITATVSGTVRGIEVAPGQRVAAGQVLATFASAVEQAELARLDRALERRAAPSLDQTEEPSLSVLRAERDLAAARLEQLSIRAPQPGVIGDVHIRPGQLLRAGELVLTLIGDDRRCAVQAVLPAQYRPQLRTGMALRFRVAGYSHVYEELPITRVGAQIVGPGEVKRVLGPDMEDTLRVEGPVVLVEAGPCAATFTMNSESFAYYHGMVGVAETSVRTERILVALMPGLRSLFGSAHD